MRWKAVRPDRWELYDDMHVKDVVVPRRVGAVTMIRGGIISRKYHGEYIGGESMGFPTLEEAQTWVQTVYRLSP